MKRLSLIFGLLLTLQACAFGDANLQIAYDAEQAKKGVISEAPSTEFTLASITDKRPETDKIGYKRNGYGMKTADIKADKPVEEIVRDALEGVLTSNGHTLVDSDAQIDMSAEITQFWFDIKMGLWTGEFIGTAEVELTLKDTESGKLLLKQTYTGHNNEETMGGLSKSWQRVMNAALADMVQKINLSPAFRDAIKKVQ